MTKKEDLIVIKDIHNPEEEYKITLRKNFETIKACETYDDYGNQANCGGVGCYSINNGESSAKNDCIEDLYKHFNIQYDSHVHIDDEYYFDALKGENELLEDIPQEKIDGFIEKWKKENEIHEEYTEAWVYHDGSNFQTVVLDNHMFDSGYEEVDNDIQDAILNEYPGQFYVEGAEGVEETENYIFRETRWANDPWLAHVTEK